MNYLNRFLAVASAAFFIAGSALAQNAGTVTNHAFALGKGAGTTGYTSLLCGSAQLAVGQSAADPICKTITGDVTINAAGATAIGATKVTSAMLNADVYSTSHSWGAQTFLALTLAPGSDSVTFLTVSGAASAARLLAGLDASGNTLIRPQNSLQLRLGVNSADFWILTSDGSFAVAQQAAPITPAAGFARLYLDSTSKVFSGKSDAGTISNMVVPSAGVSNQFLTAIGADGVITRAQPAVSNISGFGTGVATALGINVGSAGAPVVNGGALGTPASGVGTNLTGLTLAGHANQAAFTFVGNNTSGSAAPTAVDIAALTSKASPVATDLVMISDQAASGAWKKVTISSLASAGSVSSIAGNTGAFTLGTGLTNSTNDLRVSLSNITNTLGSDVTLPSATTYTDGPSMAQGTSGTWVVHGQVTFMDTAAAVSVVCKLWDGTTVIASTWVNSNAANFKTVAPLSGILASPAANIKISCSNQSGAATTVMKFNISGNSKDSTLSAHRIQ